MQFFDTLIGSFHSATLYARLRREGHYAFGYSFLLVAMCTLSTVIYVMTLLNQLAFTAHDGKPPVFDRIVLQIAQQLPTMSWHHQQLQTDVPGPTVIRLVLDLDGKSRVFDLATIDTSGATTPDNAKTPVVIDQVNVSVKNSEKTEIHALAKFAKNLPETMIINRALIDESAQRLIRGVHASLTEFYALLGLCVWLALVVYCYIARIVTLFVLAAAASLITRTRGAKIPMPQAMAIAAVSFTPVALANTLAFIFTAHSASPVVVLLAGAVTFWAALRGSTDVSSAAAPSP